MRRLVIERRYEDGGLHERVTYYIAQRIPLFRYTAASDCFSRLRAPYHVRDLHGPRSNVPIDLWHLKANE